MSNNTSIQRLARFGGLWFSMAAVVALVTACQDEVRDANLEVCPPDAVEAPQPGNVSKVTPSKAVIKNNTVNLTDVKAAGTAYTLGVAFVRKDDYAVAGNFERARYFATKSKESPFNVTITGLDASTEYTYCAYVKSNGKRQFSDAVGFLKTDEVYTGTDVVRSDSLSVDWGTHNLGATYVWGRGDYYAWGESNTYKHYYQEDEYKEFYFNPDFPAENPDQPSDPESPDQPSDPENPDQPSDPETPDQPSDPETPDQPSDPENPDQPSDPETPDQPSDPETPDQPSDPETPDQPSDPETPDQPSDPENPDQPSDPDVSGDIDIERPTNPSEDGELAWMPFRIKGYKFACNSPVWSRGLNDTFLKADSIGGETPGGSDFGTEDGNGTEDGSGGEGDNGNDGAGDGSYEDTDKPGTGDGSGEGTGEGLGGGNEGTTPGTGGGTGSGNTGGGSNKPLPSSPGDTSDLQNSGIVDEDSNLTPHYDPATRKLGDGWRMPTLQEIKELIKKCRWEWTDSYGETPAHPGFAVPGFKAYPPGEETNFIFFPAYCPHYKQEIKGMNAYYWSGTASPSSGYAIGFECPTGKNGTNKKVGVAWGECSRDFGFLIRPVRDK